MRLPVVAVAAAFVFTGAASGAPVPPGQIVFDGSVGSSAQIVLFRERPDSSGRVRVTWTRNDYQYPQWSPNGRTILAASAPGLVILSPAGRTLRRIGVAGDVYEPRWSRDGTRIAYLVLHCYSVTPEDPSCAGLWVVHADGSGRRRLTAYGVDTAQSSGTLYSWSPDGRSIVYVRQTGLAVVNVATGRTRLLAPPTNLIEQSPAWSPDGRSILFVKQRAPGQGYDLVSVAPDGSGLHRLTRNRDLEEARWSPDGTHVAYSFDLAGGGTGWGVEVARADGAAQVRVGTSADPDVLVWSPDSSRVLFPAPWPDTLEIARADGRGTPVRIRGETWDEPDWGVATHG